MAASETYEDVDVDPVRRVADWMGDRAVVEPQPGGRFIVHFEDAAALA